MPVLVKMPAFLMSGNLSPSEPWNYHTEKKISVENKNMEKELSGTL